MKLKPADEIAAEFMLGQGHPHFCNRKGCDCTNKLAELIAWARHEGAEAQRRQDAARRLHVLPVGHRIGEALTETRAKVLAAAGGKKR